MLDLNEVSTQFLIFYFFNYSPVGVGHEPICHCASFSKDAQERGVFSCVHIVKQDPPNESLIKAKVVGNKVLLSMGPPVPQYKESNRKICHWSKILGPIFQLRSRFKSGSIGFHIRESEYLICCRAGISIGAFHGRGSVLMDGGKQKFCTVRVLSPLFGPRFEFRSFN